MVSMTREQQTKYLLKFARETAEIFRKFYAPYPCEIVQALEEVEIEALRELRRISWQTYCEANNIDPTD